MNFQTMYVGNSQSYAAADSRKSAIDTPLTGSPPHRYPNSYIDDIHPVDVHSHTSNGVRATMPVPQNVTHTHYESSGGVLHSKPHENSTVGDALRDALDDLARTRSVLEASETDCRVLSQDNKQLLDQVHVTRVEFHAERQKSVNLQSELTVTNHLKRQAEAQLEYYMSECARIAKELDQEKAINANLGAETNELYERYESMREMVVASTARNKELEAQLARLYGTPKERAERAEHEKEEIAYKKGLEKELEFSATYQKMLEDDNARLRSVALFLETQLRLGVGAISVKQEDEKPQPKGLFIKEEEDDESHHFGRKT